MSEVIEVRPLRHADFGDYERARAEHDRAAASILNQLLGALGHLEASAGSEVRARTLDTYADMVREWDAKRPEWVR